MLTKITLLLSCISLAGMASADTCMKGDCENGSGVMEGKDDLYVGTFENGEKVGWATIHDDGGMYFGEVKDGKRNGSGALLRRGKKVPSLQEGIWKSGKLVKKEKMPIGTSVKSGWLNGSCRAIGSTYVYPDGKIYVGGCVDGQMEGKGTLLYFDKKVTGSFVIGKLEGEAIVTYQDGARSSRTYENNKVIGEIVLQE